MKKFAKFTAFAVGLVAMLFAGCSDVSDDAVVTRNAVSADNFRTLTIDVTSNSNLLNFGGATPNGSRTILPDAEVCDDLYFYLCSKNNTAGEATWSTPVNVTVTPKATDTTGRTGEVIINLTKADYDFELFAVQKGGSGTPPAYSSETNLKGAAVLVAYANADIRNDDTVSFYMTAEGLSTKGDVALYLYTDGWSLDDFPDFVNGSSTPVSPNAKLTYTKKTGTNAEGATYSGSESGAGFALFEDAPTAAPDYTDTKVYKANVDPGTYNFELSFTNGTKTYTWSDRIIVLPGKVTQKVIGIPLVIEKVPLAPNYLNVAYIDPESTTTEYYNAEFVWDSQGTVGTTPTEINNEEKFELQLLSVPSTVADAEITTYESALSAAATDEARATAWTSLSATAMGASAGGTTVVWSTVDGSTNTASTGTAVNVNTRVFYGNLDTWVAGSLQKNNRYAIFKLPLGSRYVARIRAVNAAGASSWVYADLSKDIKGKTSNSAVTLDSPLDVSTIDGTKDALHFTSKTINRYRVTYDLSGGTLTQGTITSTAVTSGTANTDTTNLATVYYYCQKFNTVTTSGSGPTATTTYAGGVEIMRPTGVDPDTSSGATPGATVDNNFTTLEANGANPVLVAQNPLLKLNAQTWTNWLCDLTCAGAANTKGEYNEVGKVPDTYGGCKSLTLVANYATVGTVTIFDDEKYAIADVTSASSGTSGVAAITSDGTAASGSTPAVKAVVYKIQASQKDDVTLTWTVAYPTGVTYDNVTLKLTSTDSQRSYNIGNISATKTFTLKVSEYVKGVYNAKISAWSSVKPNDPYTANIVLTIVD